MLALFLALAPAVEWTAPAECPDTATAARTIADGMPPDADVRVRAIVTATGDDYEAQVDVSSAVGETRRTLESPECSTLLDAVALIAQAAAAEAEEVAEAERDEAVEGELVPAAQPKVTQTTTREPVQPQREPATPAIEPPRSQPRELAVSPYVRATGRIGWGITPVVDGGGSLAIGLQWKRLRIEATGDLLVPTEKRVPEAADAAMRVFAWSAGLRGCGIVWTDPAERVAIPVCGGAEAGQLVGRGEGEGLAERGDFVDSFVALHAGPAALARLAPWASAYAGLDALVLARRPGFVVRGSDTIHRPAPAGIRFTLGVEIHFPRRIRAGRGMR